MQYVTASGLRFAYLEEGSGPLVLLVHGFPDTAHSWDAVRPLLARAGYRAVSPFTRGYWPTAIPQDGRYDSETLGRDVLALIEALGEQRAIVVGHDWGASAAFAAAALSPMRVRFLVSVAIPHIASLRRSWRLLWGARHILRLRLGNAEAMVRRHDFAYLDTLVRRWSPAWDVPADETAAVKAAFRQPGSLSAALGYYRALGYAPQSALLRRVSVPSAVFAGADDGVLGRDDFECGRRFFDDPHETVHMPGGHFLHREHPSHFIRELLRVLPRPNQDPA
jgi:pimeloyl-ACP methyl ester carboxylesterase